MNQRSFVRIFWDGSDANYTDVMEICDFSFNIRDIIDYLGSDAHPWVTLRDRGGNFMRINARYIVKIMEVYE